jgi:hypothetical protein
MENRKWLFPTTYFLIFYFLLSFDLIKPTLSSICSLKLVLQTAKLDKLNCTKYKFIHFDSANRIEL